MANRLEPSYKPISTPAGTTGTNRLTSFPETTGGVTTGGTVAGTSVEPSTEIKSPINLPNTWTPPITLKATGKENVLQAAGKVIVNTPLSFIQAMVGLVQAPISAVKTSWELGQSIGQGITEMGGGKLAGETIKNLLGAAYEVLVPSFLRKSIKGDTVEALKDLEQDPFGQIAPLIFYARSAAKLAGGQTAVAKFDAGISNVARATYIPQTINAGVSIAQTAGQKQVRRMVEADWNKVLKQNKKGGIATLEAEQRGLNVSKKLADKNISPEVVEGRIDTTNATERLSTENNVYESTIREALDADPRPVNLEALRKKTLQAVDTPKNRAGNLVSDMQAEVNSQFDMYKETYGKEIPTPVLQDIKIEQNRQAKVFNTEKPYASDVHYQIGHQAKLAIEINAPNIAVKELNGLISDNINTIKVLDTVNQQVIPGGRLGRMIGTAVGVSMGTTIVGKVVGGITGNYLVDIIQNTTVSNPVKRLILQHAQNVEPTALVEARNFIDKRAETSIMKRQLENKTPMNLWESSYPEGKAPAIIKQEVGKGPVPETLVQDRLTDMSNKIGYKYGQGAKDMFMSLVPQQVVYPTYEALSAVMKRVTVQFTTRIKQLGYAEMGIQKP